MFALAKRVICEALGVSSGARRLSKSKGPNRASHDSPPGSTFPFHFHTALLEITLTQKRGAGRKKTRRHSNGLFIAPVSAFLRDPVVEQSRS